MRARIAVTVSAVLVGTLLQATAVQAVQAASTLPKVPASEKPVPTHQVKPTPRKGDHAPKVPRTPPKTAWPGAGSATVTLPSKATAKGVRAGDLPVSLTTTKQSSNAKSARVPLSGQATVRVLSHQTADHAGVDGLLLSVQRKADTRGNAFGLTVDYTKFAQAGGGAYASRLRLVKLPACALTQPKATKCATGTPIPTDNDPKAKTLRATGLSLPTADSPKATGMLLAVTAGTSSDHGDYKATQLSASSAWKTNLNTGDFAWSYDMPAPDVPGSFVPKVSLSYSSGGIDGRTANSNNQASWAGDGFDLWPGFIDRSYKSCADEGVKNSAGTKVGDQCWAYDNATLSFNGHSGELIATGTNSFRIKGDDGTKVDRLYGSDTNVRANGALKDEYWRVTTTDGTRYYFGYNRLTGWATGNPETNSTWTTPVFGNDDKEPCHAATFADSWCQQGWRWNLDYAVDAHGNSIAYYYNKETNYYGRNLKASDETVYVRGGSLDHIEYGLRNTSNYSAKALGKVDFTTTERCLPETGVTCAASTIDDKSFYWYDTPWDLNCKSGVDCVKTVSPSFWTRKRLTGVATSVLKSDGTYTPIDSWKLEHRWGTSDIDYQLILDSIQHTGSSASPAITLPKVTLGYDQRANRLKISGDDTAPFIKERLSSITDESGGETDVNYSTSACDASSLPTAETNTTRCYPVYFTKEGDADPTKQWFNKYVVDSVTQTDRTLSSPDMVTRYSYLDGAAWHYDDDDGLTKEKYKTWSTWRGYGHVRVHTGGQDPVGMKSQTDHYFLRGMNGDRATPSGGTKTATVSDDNGGTITDDDAVAGFEYKTEKYSGPSGKVLEKTVNTPWLHETAKRTRSWGTTAADLTGTAATRIWTSLDAGAGSKWRQTYKTNSFENVAGRVTQTDDFGDNTTSADNQCTRITYVDNTADWILDLPARAEAVAVKCADTPHRSTDVLSDVRTAYDGQAYGTAPAKGDVTRTATLQKHDGTTATYLESEDTYDTYGRQLTDKDISAVVTAVEGATPTRTARTDGRTTTTAYTPTTGFPTTSTVTSPPATPGTASSAQTTTTTYDTTRGQPLTVLDTNNKRTDTTYDALGRSLKIWLPNRSKDNSDTPNYQYVYTIDGTGSPTVATRALNVDGSQRTSYTLMDGFLRTRQTQDPGPSGGTLLTDTFYDERGLTSKTFAPYYSTAAPSATLLKPDNALAVESQTWNNYDGLGQITKTQQIAGNGDDTKVLNTTATEYGGDRVTVTPPRGGTPFTTLVDARGNNTDLRQYKTSTATGAYDQTHYDYTPAGKLSNITDPAGNAWSFQYDQHGNQILAKDPDKGQTDSKYDDRDQLLFTSDARGKKITHVYDGLGRETETHDGDASGPLLTQNVWDPTGFEGQLATATRYVGGASGAAYKTTYSLYDNLYRPQRTTTTIPSITGEEALAGSYQSSISYNLDNTIRSTSYPAAGALPSETLTPTYDEVLRPKKLTAGSGTTYIADTVYSYTGKPLQYLYQGATKKTQINNTYEWGTQRLANTSVNREDIAGTDKSSTFSYDETGNVTSISDVSRSGTDNQCFQYDYLARLTEAWAQNTTTCATTPTSSVLGGPAPYWQSYTHDAVGNRKTETLHDTTGDTSKDVVRSYDYSPAGGPRPHAVSQVQTSNQGSTALDSYTYDDAGNTHTRTIGGDEQTLDWDTEGHLKQVTVPSAGSPKTTSYVYGADGSRLLQRTNTETTLYLGSTEVTLTKGATTAKATRYYDLGSGNQAIRTNDNKLSLLVGDHHGTSELAIGTADQTIQQRRSTPFGAPRGPQPTAWPGTKGFIGGTQDATGLVHLGAREYDPDTGRFISVDPVLIPTDPQQLNAYAYANNSPVTSSDPSGLCRRDICGDGYPIAGDGKRAGYTGQHKSDIPCTSCNTQNVSYYNPDEIFPGVFVPAKWKGRKAFIERFYSNYLDGVRGTNGWLPGYLTDGTNPEAARQQLGYWALQVCYDMRSCPQSLMGGFRDMQMGFGERVSSIAGASHDGRGVSAELPKTGSGESGELLKGACSFSSDTPVLLKSGKTKEIGDIELGDKVVTANPETGKRQGSRSVSALLVHHDDDLIDLKIIEKNGDVGTLHTTSRHPFWDKLARAWVPAGKLVPGRRLSTATNDDVVVSAVRVVGGAADMYNLTVEQLHTYYVLAGATPVLVHNSGGWCGPGIRTAPEAGIAPNDARRIQNAANKTRQTIIVVGSRAGNGNLNPTSDWDYILTGPSRARSSVKNSLPQGMGDGEGGSGRGRDFYQSYNPNAKQYTELDRDRPYVVFEPRG
ncbi:RHS repeat-associated core domain-containing protein [Streptomyces sp. NPDC005302]|uniref:RHS repeat-associated core domain-containing protein n=1 Tax=Streptomyces sp. NPDC005302 TaxID=3154675 RepID=UPI0033A30FCC